MSHLTAISRALDFVEDNLKREITVADMANAAGYSLYHFSRTFNSVVHHTPYDYLMRRRLSESARDLVETDGRIIDIAFDFGFNSPETFSRAFKRMFDVQPHQWRKREWIDERLLMPRLTLEHIEHINKGEYLRPVLREKDAFSVTGVMSLVRNGREAVAHQAGFDPAKGDTCFFGSTLGLDAGQRAVGRLLSRGRFKERRFKVSQRQWEGRGRKREGFGIGIEGGGDGRDGAGETSVSQARTWQIAGEKNQRLLGAIGQEFENGELGGVELVETVHNQQTQVAGQARIFLQGDGGQPALTLCIHPAGIHQPGLVGGVDGGQILEVWHMAGHLFDGGRQVLGFDARLFQFLDEGPEAANETRFVAQRRKLAQMALGNQVV